MLFVKKIPSINNAKVEFREAERNRALKLFLFMYYVYLIRKGDGKIYIGYTNDLRRRFREHKDKKPDLIYYEAYKDKSDAQNREKKLKQRGRAVGFLKNRIKNSLKK